MSNALWIFVGGLQISSELSVPSSNGCLKRWTHMSMVASGGLRLER